MTPKQRISAYQPLACGGVAIAVKESYAMSKLPKTVGDENLVLANGESEKKSRITPHLAKKEELRITPLRQAILTIPIVGETPLKILRFSRKKQEQIAATQRAGEQAKTKRKREAKDFEQEYEDAKYLCTQKIDGKQVTWLGLNASGVRNGAIETCRMAGFVMTKARMSVFCIADGLDNLDKTNLVRVYGEPVMSIDPVRNANQSIDLRARVMFEDWKMFLRIRFDEDQFSPSDVLNLMVRVGQQNGLGEGRPNSTNGNGTGNGLFLVNVDKCSLERMSIKPAVFKE